MGSKIFFIKQTGKSATCANNDDDAMKIFPLMLIRTGGLPLQWLEELACEWPEGNVPETELAAAVQRAFDAALSALDDSPLRTAVYNARRDFFQKRKMPGEAFERFLEENQEKPNIVQLLENLNFWKRNQNSKKDFFQRYENALQANYRLLQEAAKDETLRRALLFASHDLLDRLPGFSQKSPESFNKKDRQTALSLLQYLTRAVAKTSPLSKFTTVSLWQPARPRDTDFSISKSVVTPNVALLPALYQVLLREPAFYRALSISLNPSIVRNEQPTTKNEQLTWLYFDGENESFQQMATNSVAELTVEILLENGRKMPFSALLAQLEKEVEASPEQLQHLVFELIDYGLLEWDWPEKGLFPGWCGALYNFLGFLPEQSPLIVEAAALLQWLRATARVLPFQPLEDAQASQREAVRQVKDFFERHGAAPPPIPPEQIFFEDVEETVEADVSQEAVLALANDLAECWKKRGIQALPPFRERLFSFAEKTLQEGQVVDFLSFCKKLLEEKTTSGSALRSCATVKEAYKIGALLQIFKDENGKFRAVVNGLFPGGGKLFARWLHLFPAGLTGRLKTWNDAIPFPWLGWSNANFQPVFSEKTLAVPSGRMRGNSEILLGNLAVRRISKGVQLIDIETNEPILFTDLGLESPESRPLAMQVLWYLGVPWVSLACLLPARIWGRAGEGWFFWERVEFGSLVLARRAWQPSEERVAKWLAAINEADFFRLVRGEMSAAGVPRCFFAKFFQGKPQFFDRDCPISMILFAKMLRKRKTPPVLTEMLPLPEQCVVKKNGARVAEFVLEFEV
jgi:hypothetical protein